MMARSASGDAATLSQSIGGIETLTGCSESRKGEVGIRNENRCFNFRIPSSNFRISSGQVVKRKTHGSQKAAPLRHEGSIPSLANSFAVLDLCHFSGPAALPRLSRRFGTLANGPPASLGPMRRNF